MRRYLYVGGGLLVLGLTIALLAVWLFRRYQAPASVPSEARLA